MSQPKRVVFINPNLILQRHDVFTTGIIYMPVGLASFAAATREKGYDCQVIDAFGDAPNEFWEEGDFVYRGLRPEEVVKKTPDPPLAFFLYAINLTYHNALIKIVEALRRAHPTVPIVVLENTQAVTAYAINRVQDDFLDAGAQYVLGGEPEIRGLELLAALQTKNEEAMMAIDGIAFRRADGQIWYQKPERKIKDLDALPFPAWDLFPLKNYWSLGYAHGPVSSAKYLPLLTSRGCPYACRFCVIPETNKLKWRARSAKHVVDEIEFWQRRYAVSEFHIEDVDPTVNDKRTQAICREIIERKLKVKWKIVSGTKVETMKTEETIALMAKAGCKYISISPESGSKRLMKLINKPFNYEHAIKLVKKMNQVGIRSQTCFVLGFPGETDEDRALTRKMVKELVKVGVDEIAQFIVTPVPGSAIYDEFSGYKEYSQLNFSPTWREDYKELNAFRIRLYRSFLIWKTLYHPLKIMKQPLNFLLRSFETKMEMVPYRAWDTMAKLRRSTRRAKLEEASA